MADTLIPQAMKYALVGGEPALWRSPMVTAFRTPEMMIFSYRTGLPSSNGDDMIGSNRRQMAELNHQKQGRHNYNQKSKVGVVVRGP